MTWEPRPVPRTTPETERYWAAAADGRLLVRHCRDCDLVFHYPRARCPDCLGGNVDWEEASGEGVVYSYTVTGQAAGWPEEDLPLVIAYVELAEGPRMVTNIVDCDPEAVSCGSPVEVRFRETEREDVAIPVFTLDPEA